MSPVRSSGSSPDIESVPPPKQPEQPPALLPSQAVQGLRIKHITRNIWIAFTAISAVTATLALAAIVVVAATALNITLLVISTLALSLLLTVKLGDFSFLPPKLRHQVQKIVSYLREYGAVALAVACYPFSLAAKEANRPISQAEKESSHTPILLVPGFLANSSYFAYVKNRLHEAGFPRVYTADLKGWFPSVRDKAQQLDAQAEWIAQRLGTRSLILIGHSMGGLINLRYLTQIAQPKSVRAVINLVTPHQGSKVAKPFTKIGQALKDMSYRGPFVTAIEQDVEEYKKNHPLHLYTFTNDVDILVRPSEATSFVNKKLAVIKNFPYVGHVEFLFCDEVADELINILRQISRGDSSMT